MPVVYENQKMSKMASWSSAKKHSGKRAKFPSLRLQPGE